MTDTPQPAALITGSGLRLGRLVAQSLAGAGYAVAIHYNSSRDPAEELAAAIREAGGNAATIGQDLTDITGTQTLIERSVDAVGPLSLLVNSASLYDADTLESLTPETWQKITNVNAAAPIFLMQAFARQATAGGCIINMLDAQTAAPSSRTFSYFCAKAALEMATKLGALELAPAIRVNGVAPGLVLPSGDQTEAVFAKRQALTPLGEGLGAQDIADAVLYLAGARHVTGEIIAVDSGQRLAGFGNAGVTRQAR
jgi:NAD(P)-dependent dehydrogenase (short-subunit alcohol dehydrogenase family)